MIISIQHGFTFFHNPKAGGTSVRATLEVFHDVPDITWGCDPSLFDTPVDLAHLGVDEFITLRPALWDRIRDHNFYCLIRNPVDRFYSSVAEYAKLHGKMDTRFAPDQDRRTALFDMLDRLEGFGTAEAVMDTYELTHFKPQWIYWKSTNPDILVRTFPVTAIDALFTEIGDSCGRGIISQTRNQRETIALPNTIAKMAAHRSVRRMAQSLPGTRALKTALRKRYATTSHTRNPFGVSAEEHEQVAAFVTRFYARDVDAWPAEYPSETDLALKISS